MKIRLLSPTFGGTSGVGRHVESLSKKLMNKGYEVTVVSTNNTPYIPVKNLKNLSWAFFSCLKRERADIIHAHNLPSMIPAKTVEGKRILSIHGYYSSQIELLHGKILGKVLSLYEKKVLNWADSITCISKDTTHIYRNIGFNVEYVPNAVDVSKIEEICRDVERRPRRIVYVGRMTKEKGYGVLINALKLLSDYEFITVHGRPWIEAIKLIASSKVLIVPSFMEGLPTVILEAFASGTAVIASEIGGIFELIKDKVNGYLFKPGDYYKLANLIDLVLKDERIHKNITNKAKDKVKREYDWEQVIRKYIRIYEES